MPGQIKDKKWWPQIQPNAPGINKKFPNRFG